MPMLSLELLDVLLVDRHTTTDAVARQRPDGGGNRIDRATRDPQGGGSFCNIQHDGASLETRLRLRECHRVRLRRVASAPTNRRNRQARRRAKRRPWKLVCALRTRIARSHPWPGPSGVQPPRPWRRPPSQALGESCRWCRPTCETLSILPSEFRRHRPRV